jgi:phytoene desaturase
MSAEAGIVDSIPAVARRRQPRPAFLGGMEFDVIVVGAGLGGLATAAILARCGARVLVLEQHFVAGGNATVFQRPGYEFDIGLHYIGSCEEGGALPAVLAEAGVEDLEFLQLDPDGYDTIRFPDGYEFRYPRGLDRFQHRLLAEFPAEARGIRRYGKLLRGVQLLARIDGHLLRLLAALPRATLALRHRSSTLAEFLDTCTTNPRLRAVLAGPHLDHGLAPSRVSVLLHAGLVTHYMHGGAYYPKGGGQVIADRLVETIERNGGTILLRATVQRILVEGGRVHGVVLRDGALRQRSAFAPVVVSNADLKRTFLELLPPEALRDETRARTRDLEMSPGLGVVYIGAESRVLLRADLRNTNYWLFPGDDLEREYREVGAGRFPEAPTTCISIASFKEPGTPRLAPPGIVNLQLMAVVPSQPEAWGVSEAQAADHSYRREPAYLAAKQQLAERLLRCAEAVLPGLRSAVVFQEVATPLTHVRYTRSSNGTGYGIACTPQQFLFGRPAAATEIEGLVLAGASTRSAHGIMGVLSSARQAALAVRRALGSLGRRPALRPVAVPAVVTAQTE